MKKYTILASAFISCVLLAGCDNTGYTNTSWREFDINKDGVLSQQERERMTAVQAARGDAAARAAVKSDMAR